MIELRHLSHLLVACQHDNLTRASDDLHVAASTLSASLKALETELGYALFNRSGSGLYPRTCARWLCRAGLPLLLLERHTLRRLKTAGTPEVLDIRIGLKFTIGRASKALLRAIAETEAEEPLVLVHPVWIDDSACPFDDGWPEDIGLRRAGTITLQMIGPNESPAHMLAPDEIEHHPTARGHPSDKDARQDMELEHHPTIRGHPSDKDARQNMREHHPTIRGHLSDKDARQDIDLDHRSTGSTDPKRSENAVTLMRDAWVLAYRVAGDHAVPSDLAARTVLVPAMSRGIAEAVEAHIARCRFQRWRLLEDHPGSLPRLMNEHPDAAFLIPGSVLSERLGLVNASSSCLEPAFITTLVGRQDHATDIADRFLERLRQALARPEQTTAFTPDLTSRRLRYFNVAHRLRSVSAASRLANVAQPALSEQLRKLELTLGTRLFDRRSSGVTPTAASAAFAPVAQALEAGLQQVKVGAMSSFSAGDRRLTLGVLPSVSQHGLLINCISEALLALRANHPATRITVQEGPAGTLQDWVVRGHVGLAILETGPPQLPRLPLGASEDLAVIADPRHALLPPGPVSFGELAKLPLALPTSQFGLRQLLDSAARSQRVELRPVMEIDALAMLIAILRHEPIATILPPSAIRRELRSGELTSHPIARPSVARRLFVIYSGDRALTEPEREFVALLRDGLAESGGLKHNPSPAKSRIFERDAKQ